MLPRIEDVLAREVLDSRGKPTVEVEVRCEGGARGRAIAPSGASTARAEARVVRDGDVERYDGSGVRRAVANVHDELRAAITGLDVARQREIDHRLLAADGTRDKGRLGANAIVATSMAVAHAAAAALGQPLYVHLSTLAREQEACQSCAAGSVFGPGPALPRIMVNMISGGLHAGGNLDFQDFLVLPVGAPSYPESLEWAVRIHRRLGRLLAERGYEGRLVADEGGYGPRLESNRQAAELVISAVEKAGLSPGEDVQLALDVAATHFQQGGVYHLAATGGSKQNSSELVDYLEQFVDDFPVYSIEDGLAEDDWLGWRELTERLGSRATLIGDDLFATNQERLHLAMRHKVANGALVKIDQVGTMTETLSFCVAARLAGYKIVVSARSGETEDTTVADLAVAVRADAIKIGSVTRGERLAKYNQLLRLHEHLAP